MIIKIINKKRKLKKIQKKFKIFLIKLDIIKDYLIQIKNKKINYKIQNKNYNKCYNEYYNRYYNKKEKIIHNILIYYYFQI